LAEPASGKPVPSNPPLLERRRDVVVLAGAVEPAGVVALCERARPLFADLAENGAEPLVCDVGTLRADLAAVDVLAHLALTAHRLDRHVRLRGVPPVLWELLVLAGLADVVRCGPDGLDSGLDPGR